MDRPRTANIIARTRCLLVVLTKEDLRKILPSFPEVERAIRDEAEERLSLLERKKRAESSTPTSDHLSPKRSSKRDLDSFSTDLNLTEEERQKRRKSPSPGSNDRPTSSALANSLVNIRLLLKELPFFSKLPSGLLHFLGLNIQPLAFEPFTDIIQQGSWGREIYFIVNGEVEVLHEVPNDDCGDSDSSGRRRVQVMARLAPGQYFGEVVSLFLAPRRTATVRTVTYVECLMISEEVLAEFWERCPSPIRLQIEKTAKGRLQSSTDGKVVTADETAKKNNGNTAATFKTFNESIFPQPRRVSMPILTLTETELDPSSESSNDPSVARPSDPDPFLSISFENMRSRSRRSSLVPESEQQKDEEDEQEKNTKRRPSIIQAPIFKTNIFGPFGSSSLPTRSKSKLDSRGVFDDKILVNIFKHLDIYQLLRLRIVSHYWRHLLNTAPEVVEYLDLSQYGSKMNDDVLIDIICPFVGERPRVVDMDNCYHVTDEGYLAIIGKCGINLRCIRMKSVWDVSAWAILEMANRAKSLREIDLSNCRKVSDTLLARILGWFVKWEQMTPQHREQIHQQAQDKPVNGPITLKNIKGKKSVVQTPILAPGGCAYGCPLLKKLTLSYCKHVTDRSMHHIAHHAASRIEEINLTRCTSVSDMGFQYWNGCQFPRLRKLVLADCTYLTDAAIVCLTNAAKSLRELDLSFCCSLSDTAVEVLALGCPQLAYLNLAFCGSAVSDQSLQSVGLHLQSLKSLSVRGCVRVTSIGVNFVAENCRFLEEFDVSQCKNLAPWLVRGTQQLYADRINFITVSQDYPRLDRQWS
ncbi:hypothetical protein KEM54_006365 [Ascosphaera aggregata]|nr:hypothetical protein KEM54_006365 [Ascosphaera aggregata]